ncbi:MAG: hypothetical protein M1833_006405 [Piccolia ochrophora]|nr:MAG: hypothetical protein M1833_006405 [Piccolia ochrophora]
MPREVQENHLTTCPIPGIICSIPNGQVKSIKGSLWATLLRRMDTEGEGVMLNLIMDNGIFVRLHTGDGNYTQLSGIPLQDLDIRPPSSVPSSERSLADIFSLRKGILYARPAVNSRGRVRMGFPHKHELNQFSNSQNPEDTVALLKCILPRLLEVGRECNAIPGCLDSIGRNKVPVRQTAPPGQDSKLVFPINTYAISSREFFNALWELIRALQRRHQHCSYAELLKHYCPAPAPLCARRTQPNAATLGNWETRTGAGGIAPAPPAQASRAAITRVFPEAFWDSAAACSTNRALLLRKVDQFLRLRRFESLTLHDIIQSFKSTTAPWTEACEVDDRDTRPERQVRRETLSGLIFYVFNSFLIPLIRSNFYVTESNMHGNQLFYFRHDVWRLFSEPIITSLKEVMFEEIGMDHARATLHTRPFGFSHIRLLPKAQGARPILNLRCRVTGSSRGTALQRRSINSVLAPVHTMLNYESSLRPERLGSSLFSVGDMYPRLKKFKLRLKQTGVSQPVYFAKVDVQSCFDTIPQHSIIPLLQSISSEEEYRLHRHSEVRLPTDFIQDNAAHHLSKPSKRFVSRATSTDDLSSFQETLDKRLAIGKRSTIFVDHIVPTFASRAHLQSLLTEHLEQNVVKIGKRLYRQKAGIPQGSIISSLACNIFYAAFERERLDFLSADRSILFRLIDDFLLITLDRSDAKRFLQVMHDGNQKYGITVNPVKTLVNFDLTINNEAVPKLRVDQEFPYCGNLIDTKTLEIRKDRNKRQGTAGGFTVEFSCVPGRTFHRKALNALKIQMHPMYLSTSHNGLVSAYTHLFAAFFECATKMHAYIKCLPASKQPSSTLIIRTLADVIALAFKLWLRCGSMKLTRCSSKARVQWLAIIAYEKVLRPKQSKFQRVLQTLTAWKGDIKPMGQNWTKIERAVLKKVGT